MFAVRLKINEVVDQVHPSTEDTEYDCRLYDLKQAWIMENPLRKKNRNQNKSVLNPLIRAKRLDKKEKGSHISLPFQEALSWLYTMESSKGRFF